MASSASTFSPSARLTYLGISAIIRRQLSTASRRQSNGSFNQGWVGSYEASAPTEGPLSDASNIGAPRITPSLLKQHLDQFVVGQDRAKRTLATAVFNHYQRVQELERQDDEEEERLAVEERRRMTLHSRHPVEGREDELKQGIAVPSLTRSWRHEDEYPGQPSTTTIYVNPTGSDQSSHRASQPDVAEALPPLYDPNPLMIEKSNVLLLGPSGVGKTLMAKTLARVLEVPFSMSDCTPFTQAGYIGEDADVCVQRLLAAANYDVTRAERGIICLDEIDKIATARVSHGKDVSGEGVQQALLKIIEGTTLQIQAKQERSSPTASDRLRGQGTGYPSHNPLSGNNMGQQSAGGNKGETYNVRTDNILFICAGAFNGLHRTILDRLSKGSIGFGAQVRAAPGQSGHESGQHETVLIDEDELFEKNVPFFTTAPTASSRDQISKDNAPAKRMYNTLDLVEPQDLQKFGLIPELVGRIPISCALASLDVESLVKVLTEPRNSLVRQYMQLFSLSSIELRFTTPALYAIAAKAAKMGTGARGLRTVLERLLQDAMFETPGSKTKHVLINEDVANRKCGPVYFARGNSSGFHKMIADEESVWEAQKEGSEAHTSDDNLDSSASRSFEEYRVKATAAGSG